MARKPVPPSAPEESVSPARLAAQKAAKAAAIVDAYTTRARSEPGQAARPATQAEDLRLRELVDAAVAARGLRKAQAKPAIEACLEVLGAALAEGREVNLPGLGRLKIKRSKETDGRRVMELRLRQTLSAQSVTKRGTERVAEDDEES
ncbi:HU family DNA-binding protein [Pseudooceanicola sp.]|uniref:HU family DNA-binding protein n=1 Tax=Pseudooceanicola sp. TaxID=1914328 RepID=UPI0035C754C5